MRLLLRTQEGLDHVLEVPPDDNLAEAIWLSGIVSPRALCSGLGRCGQCQVRLLPSESGSYSVIPPTPQEREILGERVSEGWRLACHYSVAAAKDCIVIIPDNAISTEGTLASEDCPEEELLLAVDLGTTSIHWQAMTREGNIRASGQELNPQSGAGSDVMSRIAAASTDEGRERLSTLVRNFLRRIAAEVSPHGQIVDACVAANTAMTSIFADTSVQGLMQAPYSRPTEGGISLDIPDFAPVWLPPQPAPFVGGDIAAGMAWTLHARPFSFPFLFIDMGTNGECVLAQDENTAFVTSVPLGPALEGIGLACGGVAGPGSITRFSFDSSGLAPKVMGEGVASSLSGTGAISLIEVLLRLEVLTGEGMPGKPSLPVAQKIASRMEMREKGWRLPIANGVWLEASDVESILKVRAAMAVAVRTLLETAGVRASELGGIVIAGSLGEHVPFEALRTLGFVPSVPGVRAIAAGNTSLAGAGLLLLQPELRAPLSEWSRNCQIVDVTERPDFMEMYVSAMRFAPQER